VTPYEYVKDLFKASKPALAAGKQMHTATSTVLTLLVATLAALGISSPELSIDSILRMVAFIGAFWFAFTFIFVAPYRLLDADRATIKELREKLADKTEKTRISQLLSTQMMKGRDFMAQCTNPEARGTIQEAHVKAWLEETQSLVRKELGHVYFALYETPDGTGPLELFEEKSLNITWNGLRYRVANLRRMIEEFSRP